MPVATHLPCARSLQRSRAANAILLLIFYCRERLSAARGTAVCTSKHVGTTFVGQLSGRSAAGVTYACWPSSRRLRRKRWEGWPGFSERARRLLIYRRGFFASDRKGRPGRPPAGALKRESRMCIAGTAAAAGRVCSRRGASAPAHCAVGFLLIATQYVLVFRMWQRTRCRAWY